MSDLMSYTKRELELAGLFDEDADYDGAIPAAVLSIVEVFAKQGHSGGSAFVVLDILDHVLRYKPLTELTSNPDEWNEVTGPPTGGEALWQSARRPSTFSRDGGQTWYDIDDAALNNGDVWQRENNWHEVLLGTNVKGGERVRVKPDAYTLHTLAEKHNGREGRLVGTRNGVCSVEYDDGTGQYQHEPEKIEVFVP